jgi:hypothetical protein
VLWGSQNNTHDDEGRILIIMNYDELNSINMNKSGDNYPILI